LLLPQRGGDLQPRVAALRGYPGKNAFPILNRKAVAPGFVDFFEAKMAQPRCG
jgi:hypothetical protein